MLARAAGARRVIECGTAIGVSTLHLARAVGEGGHVVSFDVDPDRQATARGYLERAGVADRVDLRLQPALDGLASLDGVFDLAFLDAIKSEYAAYIELVLPLLRPGGLLIIDNSLMGGNVAAGKRVVGRLGAARHRRAARAERGARGAAPTWPPSCCRWPTA